MTIPRYVGLSKKQAKQKIVDEVIELISQMPQYKDKNIRGVYEGYASWIENTLGEEGVEGFNGFLIMFGGGMFLDIRRGEK